MNKSLKMRTNFLKVRLLYEEISVVDVVNFDLNAPVTAEHTSRCCRYRVLYEILHPPKK